MKILALTKYSKQGASSRYRFYNYQKYFSKEDINMEISPLFNANYFKITTIYTKVAFVLWAYLKRFFIIMGLLIKPKKYDLLLIEYELFAYFPVWFEFLLIKRGIKYIVDYDDALFHKYDKNILLKSKIFKVIEYASKVIICNTYLENYAKKYNQNTFKIPTVVLLEKYKEAMKKQEHINDSSFVIGWIGSRTTSIYIVEILDTLELFMKKYNDVVLHLVGFDENLLSKSQKESTNIKCIKWHENTEIEDILDFDIGIMPLRDDAWSRGKCAFKLIQYMSAKKAVIASVVGMNRDLIKEGVNGLLVSSDEEWLKAFEKLYLNKKLREQMAQNNFAKIEKHYHHRKLCQKYTQILRESINA